MLWSIVWPSSSPSWVDWLREWVELHEVLGGAIQHVTVSLVADPWTNHTALWCSTQVLEFLLVCTHKCFEDVLPLEVPHLLHCDDLWANVFTHQFGPHFVIEVEHFHWLANGQIDDMAIHYEKWHELQMMGEYSLTNEWKNQHSPQQHNCVMFSCFQCWNSVQGNTLD